MTKITTLGIDLAKSVFQIATLNSHGKLINNKPYSRSAMIRFIANLPPCTVGMEACGSAHYWAKRFQSMGHRVRLLPPVFVKGFLYGNKHDANDAKAIAIAVQQPQSPSVQIKSPDQLAMQAILRIRLRRVNNRTQCANQIRGLLYEHGVVIKTGIRFIQQIKPEQIPQTIQDDISSLLNEFVVLDQLVKESEQRIQSIIKHHPIAQRLMVIPGFGPLNAIAALVINPNDFSNGRHYSAYLGLTPKLTGSGGKHQIKCISKRGNHYHRKLLCDAARVILNVSKTHSPIKQWAKRIQLKKGHNIAVAALANKLARISFKVLQGSHYDPMKTATI